MAPNAHVASAAEQKHPRGLYVLFGTEMWERFGFYTVNGMLALYVRDATQGFGFSNAQAAVLSSWYLGFVYFSPLLGGFLADRILGFRRAIMLGALFFVAGYSLLAVPHSLPLFYTALGLLVIGNGLFKPNVSSMVGNLYPEGSRLKDKAYLIFYMGINIGAFIAPVLAEIIQPRFGFNIAFAMGAVGMLIGLTLFASNQRYVRDADTPRDRAAGAAARADFARTDASTGHQQAVATTEDLPPVVNERAQAMDAVPEWKRIVALLVIFAIVIVFWMIFHQNSITLTFWANDHTDWNVTGILSNAINPMWIILLSLPLASFWGWLDRKGLEPSTPAKMMVGMLLTAASFTILFFAARAGGFDRPVFRVAQVTDGQVLVHISPEARRHLAIASEPVLRTDDGRELWVARLPAGTDVRTGQFVRMEADAGDGIEAAGTRRVSPWWLILAYGVLSLGELMLSPMGLALVSKVAPIRMRGLMMGGWFAATAIGNKLTAIGRFWDLWSHAGFFITLAAMAAAMAALLLLLLRPLKKAMPGV